MQCDLTELKEATRGFEHMIRAHRQYRAITRAIAGYVPDFIMPFRAGRMGPGKFEASGTVGEMLHGISLDGCNQETGDVEYGQWSCLLDFQDRPLVLDYENEVESFEAAILWEDSQGFVDYKPYATMEEAAAQFEMLETEYADSLEGMGVGCDC